MLASVTHSDNDGHAVPTRVRETGISAVNINASNGVVFVGSRVAYRHWASDAFATGTVTAVYGVGDVGNVYGTRGTVTIKRDGYAETSQLPGDKASDADYVVTLASHVTVTRRDAVRYPYRVACDTHGKRVFARTDSVAHVAGNPFMWCDGCADASAPCECNGGAPCADCADAIAADAIPAPVDADADAYRGISYVASNTLSNGGYAREYVFSGLPVDGAERAVYRALRERLDGAGIRYAVISRETTADNGDGVSELSVIVLPSAVWLADVMRFTGVYSDGQRACGCRRYVSDGCEYYTADGAVNERYCMDVYGISDARLSVIESAAGIA